jgi:hypothetical protein
VKGFGAHKAFDYKNPECGKSIREYTNDNLTKVWDTIASSASVEICAEAISSKGGRYISLTPLQFPRPDVRSGFTSGYSALGEYFQVGPKKFLVHPSPEVAKFGREWAATTDRLWAEKKIQPPPIEIGNDGLKGVFDGLQRLKDGKVSAKKLVYRVEETP